MTNFVKYFKLPAITITSIILASCGGGDDGDDPITNSAPAFPSSSAAVNFAENSTDVVYTASATDAEGNTITYALSGGDDQDQFSIGTSSGALQFKSPPDHENPSDDGGNNVYEVEISASDNSASSKMTLEVTVTNVVEDGDQSYVNMFIDDFTDALSTQWRSYGSPSPQIVDSFAGKDYVFDNNGDSNYDSGVVSINTFSLAGEEIEISADIYVDFDDLSGCWNGAELGLTSESNPDVSSTGFDGSHALRWRLHAEGDACWATPSDKRRQAWFNLGVLNEDGEWVGINYASDNAISGDPYVNSWQNARIVISKDGVVDFLIDSKLLWTSTEAIGAQYLNGKNLFLGHRSSGSAGKSYHDNILIEKNSSQQEEEQAVPATPYAPTASADSSSSIAISWSSVDNTTYYQLYQNTSNSSSSAEKIYEGSSTAGIEYDLNANTTYYYWLKACNDVGCSSFSPPTSATTEEEGDDHGDAQSAATVISLNSSVSGVIDTGDDVDYFEVVLTQSGDLTIYTEGSLDTKGWLEDSSGSILASNDDGGLSTNFSISSSLDSSTYYIRVESYGSRTGEYTLYVQFEAEQNDVLNPLPENFSATAADGEVTLSWTHYPNAIYNIYRSDNPGCDLININSCSDSLGQSELLDDKSSPFTDQGLTNGTRYYYWIEVIFDGTTYLDDNSISATPTAEDDGIDINEDDYQTIYTHTDGTIYAVTKETMNWDDARAMAQEQGGDLATIHTEAENELIAELLNGETGWLGGSDDGNRIIGAFETVASSSEDGWRWIDSSEFVYENWHGTNEPNDSGTEDCLQMNYSSHTEGSWNDQSCANDFYAVFEFLGVHNFNGATALLVNDSSSPDIVSEEFITIMQEAGEVTLVDPEDITTGNIDINGFAHIGCFIYGGSSSVSNIDSETGEIISSWLNLGGTLVVNPEACGGKLLDLMDLATFGSRSNWYPALDDSKFFTEVPSDHPYFQDITPFTGEPSDYSVDYWDSGEHDSMIFRVDNSQSYTGRYGVDDYLVDPDRYLAKCFGTGWEVGSEHDCYREWDIGSGSIVMAKDLLWTFDQAEKTGGYIGIAGRKFLQNMVSVNISSAWKSHGGGSLNHKSSGRAYARQSVDNFEIIWQKTLGGSAVYPVAGDTDGDGVNDLIALADDIVYTIDRGGYSTQFNIQHGNSRYLLLSDTDGDNTSEIFVGGSENDNDTLTVGIYSGDGTLINNLVRISGYDSSVQPVSYINENRLIVRYDSGYSRDPRGVGLWNLASDEEEFYFDIGPAAVTHSDGGLSILDVNGDGLLEIAINVFTPHNGASGNGFNGNGSNTSDGDLYTILINEEGEELLSQKIGEDTSGGANGRAEHKFADIDNDGNYEIIATVAHEASYYTGDAQIRILELDGTERDRVSVGNNAYQIGMIITDINNDGYSELVIRDEAEDTIEIYDYELELVKKISVDGSSDDRIWTHSASDINGDGIQEILVSVDDVLYVYSGMDLQLLDQFTLSTHIIYAFATDLNNDDLAEIVVGTNSGELYLLGTPEDGDNDSTTPATPSAPTATANGSSSVTIGWSSVNEATYYQLYQNTSNSSSSATKIYDDSGTTTTQENLSASTTYYYWLKACNDSGCSDFSPSVNVITEEQGDDHDDSSSGATVISLNSSVSGVIDTGDDVDYFEVVLTQNGDLIIYTEGSLDTKGRLEDSSGSTLASNDDAGSSNNFSISSSLDSGTYYIRVESYSSRTGEYTLYTEFEEEQIAPAIPSAPIANANSSSSVTISWSSVSEATYYQLYQNTSNSSSSATKVYDDDGTSTTQDNLSASTTYYYWLKTCNDVGCSDFSQSVNVITDEEGDDHDDSRSSATVISLNSSVSGLIDTGDDIDYFEVVLTQSGDLKIYTEGSLDTKGRLEDSSGSTLASNDDSGSGNNFSISSSLDSGTYYIRVESYSSRTGEYILHTEFEEEQTAPATPSAPIANANSSSSVTISWSSVSESTYYQLYQSTSNSSSSATEIYEGSSTNTTKNGLTGNTTYYYWLKACNDAGCSDFSQVSTVVTEEEEQTAPSTPPSPTATANSSSSVTISWSSVSEATYYQLYQNTSNSSSSATKIYDDGGTSITQDNLNASTTYYYWLKACNDSGCSDFSPSVNVITEEQGDDHDDSSSGATVISLNSSVSGVIDTGDDVDYFEVVLTQNGDLIIYTEGSLDTKGRLEDSSGSTLASNDDAGSSNNFSISSSLDSGTYYIRVESYSSRTGEYTLYTEFEEEQIAPAIPSAPIANANSSSSVTISWSSVSEATYYQLYQNTSNSSSSATKVYDDDGTSTTQDNLSASTTYYYWLKTCNDVGCSDFSQSVNVITDEEGDDHDDSRSSATVISLNSSVSGLIDTGDDIDYFEVVLTQSGDLKIYTEGSLDTKGRLEDSSGSTLASNDDSGSGNNFSISSSLDSGTYYIRVESYSSRTGEYILHTEFEEEQTAPATPSAPIANANSSSSVTISWSSVSESTYYQLYQSTSNSSSSATEIYEGSSTNTTKNGLTGNTTYYYWLKACNDAGCSDFSQVSTVVTEEEEQTAPSTPPSPTATANSSSSVTISWSSVSEATYYQLYQNTSNSSSSATEIYEGSSTNTTKNGLTGNTTHYYWLKACNDAGCSGFSSSATALTIPNVSTSLSADPEGDGDVDLSWNSPSSGGAANYKVYARENSSNFSSSYLVYENVSSTSIEVDDDELSANDLYYFAVQACNASGCSDYSSSANTYTAPDEVDSPNVSSITDSSAYIYWDEPNDNSSPNLTYSFYYDDDSSTSGAQNGKTTSTSATISSLDSDEKYWVWIKSCNEDICSTYSDSVTFTTSVSLPGTCSAPTVSEPTEISLLVNFTSSTCPNSDEYIVYWDDDSNVNGAYSVTVASTINLGVEIATLDPNEQYWFWLKGKNDAGTSEDYSNSETKYTLPSEITNLHFDNTESTSVRVDWSSGNGGAEYYKVYRDGSHIGNSNSTYYEDDDLSPNTSYWYRVLACNPENACSSYDTEMMVTTDGDSTYEPSLWIKVLSFDDPDEDTPYEVYVSFWDGGSKMCESEVKSNVYIDGSAYMEFDESCSLEYGTTYDVHAYEYDSSSSNDFIDIGELNLPAGDGWTVWDTGDSSTDQADGKAVWFQLEAQ